MVLWQTRTEGTEINRELLKKHLSEIDYSFMEDQSVHEELTFRNGAYHLAVRPKKLITRYQLHIDTIFWGQHENVINKSKSIEKEAERIRKYLEKNKLDSKAACL